MCEIWVLAIFDRSELDKFAGDCLRCWLNSVNPSKGLASGVEVSAGSISIPSEGAGAAPSSIALCCGLGDKAGLLLPLLSATSSSVNGSSGLLVFLTLKDERLPWLRLNVCVSDCLLKFSSRGCDSSGQLWGELIVLAWSTFGEGLQFFLVCIPALEFGGLLFGTVTYSK